MQTDRRAGRLIESDDRHASRPADRRADRLIDGVADRPLDSIVDVLRSRKYRFPESGVCEKTTDAQIVKPRTRFTPHITLEVDWRVRRMGVARSVVYFAATDAMPYPVNVMVGGHGGQLQSGNI